VFSDSKNLFGNRDVRIIFLSLYLYGLKQKDSVSGNTKILSLRFYFLI